MAGQDCVEVNQLSEECRHKLLMPVTFDRRSDRTEILSDMFRQFVFTDRRDGILDRKSVV